MRGRVLTAVAAAFLGALASVVLLAAFYLLRPDLHIDFEVDPPRLMSGVYPAERDAGSGLTFAWTAGEMALRLPGLDRRVSWSLGLRVRGARPVPSENPEIVVFVDGVQALTHASQREFTDVHLTIPSRPERPRGALITVQVSRTFVPGPGDPRALGVMLDAVRLSPDGLALPPPGAFAGAARAGGALAAAVALLGVTPGSAVGAAILLGAGMTSVLAAGFGPFTGFPQMVARLAFGIAAGLVVASALLERVSGARLRNTARFAAAFAAAVLFLRLVVMLHPDMPVGDALFQAHRFQQVLAGNFYFTSIAPGNYLFPYAPGLYVAALPFADLVRREAGDIVLLRIVVETADALVAVLLYSVVARGWGDRRGAAMATALYLLLPLGFLIATGGTLTNAFAQSVGVVSLVVMAAPQLRLERLHTVGVLAVALGAAFLSHTSTFAILSVATALVAATFAWRGGLPLRSAALAVLAAGVAAMTLAIAIYYAHFLETYRTELARLTSETAAAAPDAGGRGIIGRAAAVPRYLNEYLGISGLLLAAWGALRHWRRGSRDQLTLAAAAWGAACLAFLVIGVLTPVDMRYYLAALPVVAIFAAAGASHGWSAGGWRRALTAALLVWALWRGVDTWRSVLG